jgi:hypothetical protein
MRFAGTNRHQHPTGGYSSGSFLAFLPVVVSSGHPVMEALGLAEVEHNAKIHSHARAIVTRALAGTVSHLLWLAAQFIKKSSGQQLMTRSRGI